MAEVVTGHRQDTPPSEDDANIWEKGGHGYGVKGKETLCVHSPDSIFFPPFFFRPKVTEKPDSNKV